MIALASGARAQVGSPASEDQVKDLLVMLTAEFAEGGSQTGAGIIFAQRNNRVYIATARHTLWSGENAAAHLLRVRFKWMPEDVPAIKASKHEDPQLDLAVLIVENAGALNIPALPFHTVGDAAGLRRGDSVRRMGYPYSRAWYSRPLPDTVSDINDPLIGFDGELHVGYSGGGLFDGQWRLVGMLKQDSPPNGEAVSWVRIEQRLRTWGYAVDLAKPAEPVAGESRLNKDDGLPYVWIPPGQFTMGCSPDDEECYGNEKPPVPGVRIAKGFWMGQTEVTVDAYRRYADANRIAMPPGTALNRDWKDGLQPVVNVSWEQARRYCEEGAKGRLPTEAEWEYAARAGGASSRQGSLDGIAWHRGNSRGMIPATGQKGKNVWNLHDMLGSAWEWVADWYQGDYYFRSARIAPPGDAMNGPASGTTRVVRGGGFDSGPADLRVSYRVGYRPAGGLYNLGFRCVRAVIPSTR